MVVVGGGGLVWVGGGGRVGELRAMGCTTLYGVNYSIFIECVSILNRMKQHKGILDSCLHFLCVEDLALSVPRPRLLSHFFTDSFCS